MSEKQLPSTKDDMDAITRLVVTGDLSKLNDKQKTEFYIAKCEAAGLDWRTQPYDYVEFDGVVKLAINKVGMASLNKQHKCCHRILEAKEILDGKAYVVTAEAYMPDGRSETASKFVQLFKERGEWKTSQNGKKYFQATTDQQGNQLYDPLPLKDRLNAYMRCETGAKNRASKALFGESGADEDDDAPPSEPPVTITEHALIQGEAQAILKAEIAEGLESGVLNIDAKKVEVNEDGEVTDVLPNDDDQKLKEAELHRAQGNETAAKHLENAALITATERSALFRHVTECGFQLTELSTFVQATYKKPPKDLTNYEAQAVKAHFTSIRKTPAAK